MTKPVLPVYHLPGHLIRRCHQISLGIFHDECKVLGLTPIQYGTLAAIQANPRIEQITLSGLIGVDRTSIGDVLLRLEKRGLIARNADEKDRRLRRLTITGAGTALLASAQDSVMRVQERLLAPLDSQEQALFLRLLGRIVEANNEESRVPVAVAAEDCKAAP